MKKAAFFALVFAAALADCSKKTEGCTDADAQNFAVDADRACDTCCVFPKLKINFAYLWDDAFVAGAPRLDAAGKPFTVEKIAFYASDFALVRADGSTARVQDSLSLRVFPDSASRVFQRQILLGRDSLIGHELGELVARGAFTKLRFLLGLSAAENRAIPALAPRSFPLAGQPLPMWASPDLGYHFLKAVIKRDTAAAAPREAIAFGQDLGSAAIELDFQKPRTFARGKTVEIALAVDVKKWFEGASMTEPAAQLAQKIRANAAQSFIIIE